MAEARDQYLATMSEAELQAAVVSAAAAFGWLCYYTHDSRKSPPGYPDLTLVNRKTGQLMFLELKSLKGELRTEQRQWLGCLGKQHDARVVRPDQLDDLICELSGNNELVKELRLRPVGTAARLRKE